MAATAAAGPVATAEQWKNIMKNQANSGVDYMHGWRGLGPAPGNKRHKGGSRNKLVANFERRFACWWVGWSVGTAGDG